VWEALVVLLHVTVSPSRIVTELGLKAHDLAFAPGTIWTALPVLGGVGVGELVKEGGLPTNGTGEPCKVGGDGWTAGEVPLEDDPGGEDRTDGPPPPNENEQVLDAALRKNMTVVINSKIHFTDASRRCSFRNTFRRRFRDSFIRRPSLQSRIPYGSSYTSLTAFQKSATNLAWKDRPTKLLRNPTIIKHFMMDFKDVQQQKNNNP
jgi:hypothetical protein